MLGEVSPTFACAKAAAKAVPAAAQRSMSWAATPLLSPLMRELVLLMEVQCTGNQVMAPKALPHSQTNFNAFVVLKGLTGWQPIPGCR